jgi:hypothetical protein
MFYSQLEIQLRISGVFPNKYIFNEKIKSSLIQRAI